MKWILALLTFCFALPVLAIENIAVNRARASETLPNQGKNNYDVANLIDGDYKTIWAATFKGSPITLEFSLDAYEVAGMYIKNGYWRDFKSMVNNSRAKRMKIYVNSKSNLVMTVDLEDASKDYQELMNEDALSRMESQKVYLGQFITFPKVQNNVKNVILEIESIYEGKKWKDLCVSSVAFWGERKNPVKEKSVVGTFKDPRDGEVYKTTTIGNVTWFAENLRYDAFNSGNEKDEKTGVLYKRSAAGNACPAGWKLPTQKDWKDLVKIAGAVEWLTDESVANRFNVDFCVVFGSCELIPYAVDRLNFGLKFSLTDLYDGECSEEGGSGYGGSAQFWTSDYVENNNNMGGEDGEKVRYDYVTFGKYFVDSQNDYCSVQTQTDFANIRCVKK